MPDTAVVVVNYNGGAYLDRCLPSVRRQDPPPAEILVVDNASSDGSADALPAGVSVLRRPTNAGFADAAQAGIDATNAPFVLLLNPDTELGPGCLAAAAAALAADESLGAVAPRVLDAADPHRIDASGLGLTSLLGQLNVDHGLPAADLGDTPRPILGPLGGAALLRRAAVERVGGFCPRYFLYWEDMDLAVRLLRAGYGCTTVPSARVLHAVGGTVGHHSARNVFYMVRNHAACLLATLPGELLRKRFGAWLLAPPRAALLYASRGRPFAALAGLLAAPFLLPGAWSRRADIERVDAADAAARLAAFMADADENRRRLKAHARRAP